MVYMNNLMNLKYFEKPTQVMFVNPDAPEDKCWNKDEVIWAFNSWVFSMIEIYTVAQQRNCKNYIYPYSYWVDLTDEIFGDYFPKGLGQDLNSHKIIEIKCD